MERLSFVFLCAKLGFSCSHGTLLNIQFEWHILHSLWCGAAQMFVCFHIENVLKLYLKCALRVWQAQNMAQLTEYPPHWYVAKAMSVRAFGTEITRSDWCGSGTWARGQTMLWMLHMLQADSLKFPKRKQWSFLPSDFLANAKIYQGGN